MGSCKSRGRAGAWGALAILSLAAVGPAPADDNPQQLSEVVITGQKTRQTLEQVPASVTSIGGDFIRDTGVRSYDELQNYSANTNLEVSSSSTQILVRGLGTLNDVPGLDPSVGVVVDGVVYTYPEYLSAFFSDLDHFEVLRGPQGTLFGKNVTAGLLNVITNAPDRDPLLHVDALWRSYGDLAFQPVLNVPLGSHWAARFSGNMEHGDRGAFYNTDLKRIEGAPQQDSGRMRLRYDSGNGWTMDLGAFLSTHEQNFNKQQLFIVQPNMLALDHQYDPSFTPQISTRVSENVPAREGALSRGVSVTFDGDLGHPGGMQSLNLISITGLAENVINARDIDADFSPVPFIRDSLVRPEAERQLTQELRVTGKAPDAFGFGHEATFVAGLYYDNYTLDTSDNFQIQDDGAALAYIAAADADSKLAGNNFVRGSGGIGTIGGLLGGSLDTILNTLQALLGQPLIPPQNAQSGLHQRTKDYAAFGNAEWFFTEHFALLAGLRYAKEDRNGNPHSTSTSELIKLIAGQSDFNLHLHHVETDFSPKAGIKWQPGSHTEAYFTWSKGYKSGGFNSIALNSNSIEFKPEKASSYEAGFKIKDHLWGGPIRGSFSVFSTHFSDLQVSTFQGTNPIVVNAAAARSRGFESDMTWLLPVRGLSLYGSFGFADARYTSYPNGVTTGDNYCAGVPPPKSNNPNQAPPPCNLGGKRLPFAPDWTASLTPAYTLAQLPFGVSASGAVDIQYQGTRFLNSEDDPRQFQRAVLLINPRLIFADAERGDWALNFGIQNLTKQVYSDQVIDEPLAPGNFAIIRTDRGRFYTASFFMNFH